MVKYIAIFRTHLHPFKYKILYAYICICVILHVYIQTLLA